MLFEEGLIGVCVERLGRNAASEHVLVFLSEENDYRLSACIILEVPLNILTMLISKNNHDRCL